MNESIYRKRLNTTERKKLAEIIDGKADPNSQQSKRFLDRPHVAVALEAILDNHRLSDDQLAKRLELIIYRRPSKSKSGITNITSIDANAHNTIRTIWQAKGKFVDKKELELKGGISELPEEQLDKIIKGGVDYLHIKKNIIRHRGRDDEGNDVRNTPPRG